MNAVVFYIVYIKKVINSRVSIYIHVCINQVNMSTYLYSPWFSDSNVVAAVLGKHLFCCLFIAILRIYISTSSVLRSINMYNNIIIYTYIRI